MKSLSDKLKSMGVRVGPRELRTSRRPVPIDQVVPGRILSTPAGESYLAESHYPEGIHQGTIPLHFPPIIPLIFEWAGISDAECWPAEAFAFVDTETTGLAGGAGTFAFLVGLGRFDARGFQLDQFFMRDPSEEPAMLTALEAALASARILVTFNGKAFDVPLLTSRYVINGWEAISMPEGHLDLLHLARRLWRERLPRRALGDLETQILGLYRTEEEVPGWMVPQMYVDYLQTGDAEPLGGVFYHNAMDILSMAALLIHITEMFVDPSALEAEDGLELVAIAKICEEIGHTERAMELYAQGMNRHLPPELLMKAQRRLSLLFKRRGDFESAVNLWQGAAQEGEVYAFVELAKYYEHRVRDIDKAEGITRAALDLISSPDSPPLLRYQWLAELEHRHGRLKRKMGFHQE